MPPSTHHAIFKEHRMTDIHNAMVILGDDEAAYYPYSATREESTSLTSLPPAFNPDFVGAFSGDSVEGAGKSAMAPVQIQTVDDMSRPPSVTNKTNNNKVASAPVTAETVDPFIAAVFQCGFHDKEIIVIDDDDDEASDLRPRSCLDGRMMAARTLVSPNDRLEKRFVEEPRRKADANSMTENHADGDGDDGDDVTTFTAAVTMAESTAATSSSSSSTPLSCSPAALLPPLIPAVTGHHVPAGTKANPPSEPRFIPLTRHQSHYDRLKPYAQIIAWRSQQRTRDAVERALRIKQKHGPLVKRVVQKSFRALKQVSKRSYGLAVHHGPIVGRKVKRMSIRTFEGIQQQWESNHPILHKSKNGIENVWTRQIRGTRASF